MERAASEFIAFAENDYLVAHNAAFDMGVISSASRASFVETPSYDYLCSLSVARKTYHLDSYKLPSAAMAAGFEDFQHHNALADSQACAAIIVHAARRHGASDILELAEATNSRMGRVGTAAPDVSAAVTA